LVDDSYLSSDAQLEGLLNGMTTAKNNCERGEVRDVQVHDDIAKILLAVESGSAVLAALQVLLHRDSYLLETNVNERSITHRLAMYLQEQLPLWHVDCEYNRDGHLPKRIGYFGHGKPDVDDTDAKTVYPDIIAHHRGTDENYLVIELKKTSSSEDRRDDHEKLRAYRIELGYEFALFVELQTGNRPGVATAQWIDDSELG
jgi:hypothetical protein